MHEPALDAGLQRPIAHAVREQKRLAEVTLEDMVRQNHERSEISYQI